MRSSAAVRCSVPSSAAPRLPPFTDPCTKDKIRDLYTKRHSQLVAALALNTLARLTGEMTMRDAVTRSLARAQRRRALRGRRR